MPDTLLPNTRTSGDLPPLLACVLAALVSGCDTGESTQQLTGERLSFVNPQSRTVFSSGSLEFAVAPWLAGTEQIVCKIDLADAEPCATDARNGTIDYLNLGSGLHEFSIEMQSADGTVIADATHFLEVVAADVVVFGANPGGVTAATAAARAGRTVVLIEPSRWIGGMIAAGLTKTDIGRRGAEILGGLTAEFFSRARTELLAKGVCPGSCLRNYDLEPHIAEDVFADMLRESRVVVERSTELIGVAKHDAEIAALVTSRGEVTGRVFIDASDEGDLMALAGVPYWRGREARLQPDSLDARALAAYEEHAGTPRYRLPLGLFVDPYRIPGDPSSGTLSFVEQRPKPMPSPGSADSRVMASTFRLCVTDDPSNRTPFYRPESYDPADYEAHARVAQALAMSDDLSEIMFNPAPTVLSRNRAYYKYDLNGGSTFSSDMTAPQLNQAYIEADDAQRERIRSAYRTYTEGLLWTWQTDPRFGSLNSEISRFGYCADEFTDRNGWPHKLYVRIARRMLGEYTMNENDVVQNGRRAPIADPVGFGAYDLDMHTHRYFAAPVDWPDGIRRDALVYEGFLIERLPNNAPYPISYRALVPQAADATNLLNPVTLSATQVAYSSIRMEPTFMILGESAGIAAALVAESGENVQDLSYDRLRVRLIAAGQILDSPH